MKSIRLVGAGKSSHARASSTERVQGAVDDAMVQEERDREVFSLADFITQSGVTSDDRDGGKWPSIRQTNPDATIPVMDTTVSGADQRCRQRDGNRDGNRAACRPV